MDALTPLLHQAMWRPKVTHHTLTHTLTHTSPTFSHIYTLTLTESRIQSMHTYALKHIITLSLSDEDVVYMLNGLGIETGASVWSSRALSKYFGIQIYFDFLHNFPVLIPLLLSLQELISLN